MELDILGAISRLYGDCSQEPGGPIFVGATEATTEQLAAAALHAQVELDVYNSNQYQRDRKYPSIASQLDQLYWDMKNGTNTWETTIDAIKAEYPKGEA